LVRTCREEISGGHRDALVVRRVASEVGLLQPLQPEHRVTPAGVEVEGPAVLVVGRPAQPEREHVLQAQELPDDDRPGRPRARLGRDQPVAAGVGRPGRHLERLLERVLGAGRLTGDPVGEVVGVALEGAGGGDVRRVVRHA
jgi:hypothetical protein